MVNVNETEFITFGSYLDSVLVTMEIHIQEAAIYIETISTRILGL